MKFNKSYRLLYMFHKLIRGNSIVKKELSGYFSVDEKTIQRDINELRAFLYEGNPVWGNNAIHYDHRSCSYRLIKQEDYFFTEEEALALAKILLDSRAFNIDEMNQILNKLLLHIDPSQRSCLKKAILNESYHYIGPQHGKYLLSLLWHLNLNIQEQNIIRITYCRMDGTIHDWELEPLGLIFSEFYFYLIAQIHNGQYESPAIYRIDRIQNFIESGQHFLVPYTERFQEGEFRKRIQFMYGGELLRIKFAFWGSSLEAILDRLPTARIIGQDGNKTILEAEVYGEGIKMWFLSQAQHLEVLKPEQFRQDIKRTIGEMANIYTTAP
jgi:predicted DNA-binding transcriptional regulator YafY